MAHPALLPLLTLLSAGVLAAPTLAAAAPPLPPLPELPPLPGPAESGAPAPIPAPSPLQAVREGDRVVIQGRLQRARWR